MQKPDTQSFDLIRVSRAKRTVDLSSNTIRTYAQDGLNLYRMGRAVFFSRSELEAFIREKSAVVANPVRIVTPIDSFIKRNGRSGSVAK